MAATNEKEDKQIETPSKNEQSWESGMVEQVCQSIVDKLKLDPSVVGTGFNEIYDLEEARYDKVVKQHCVLLNKLIQFGSDSHLDQSLSTEKKVALLQALSAKISKINSKINAADSLLDIREPFLSPIDDSFYIQSDLKEIVSSMSKSILKSMIDDEHHRTIRRKRLDSEDELPQVALLMSMRDGSRNMNEMYQFLMVYRQVCQKLNLMPKIQKLKVDPMTLHKDKEYIEQCKLILGVACDFYKIPKEDTENDADLEQEQKTSSPTPADCVKLDPVHARSVPVYYTSDSLKNVYEGGVTWSKDLDYGCNDYYGLDCGTNFLAFAAGTDWKFREPCIGCYRLDSNARDQMESIKTDDNMCRFKNVPAGCFVDDLHDICWYWNGSGIRGVSIGTFSDPDEVMESKTDDIEDTLRTEDTQDTETAEKTENSPGGDENDEVDQEASEESFEESEEAAESWYSCRLQGKGSVNCGLDRVVALHSSTGTLSIWELEPVLETLKDPEQEKRAVLAASTTHVTGLNKNCNDWYGLGLSYIGDVCEQGKICVSCDNMVVLYDLNKLCLSDVLLGGRYAVQMPRRQHLFMKDRSTLVAHNWHCCKVFDIRLGGIGAGADNSVMSTHVHDIVSKVSINGSGSGKLDTVLGFDVAGHKFIATGGGDEAVTVWDLRHVSSGCDGALYEVSTGNCVVRELAWHEESQRIFATTECEYVDRLGQKYYGNDRFEVDYGSDGEGGEAKWPQRAVHPQTYFKDSFDAGRNALYSYSFLPKN